jgi:hypothetical protein
MIIFTILTVSQRISQGQVSMDSDLVKTILGSSAIVSFLIAMIGASIKIYEHRSTHRREDDLSEQDWNSRFRAAAEAHLPWDQTMRSRVTRHELLINELRIKQGMDLIEFPEIPPAPPLFPIKDK